MVDLTDNEGHKIWSGPENWYKIVLADGSELGISYPGSNPYQIQVVPAGRGMVVRYQRFDGDDRLNQGWPIGDKGYFRCMQLSHDGKQVLLNMGISGQQAAFTAMAENNAHGMRAEQLAHNRVALYGYNAEGRLCGLRVRSTSGNAPIDPHYGEYLVGLDCEFVKVSTKLSQGTF
ncbi:hypothetical protein FBEOM_7368 [Fusarium beomiforme]|uniref:Uncharacterized protein n=1 Tax=Fusarium beomiforme TaxID=44412 RepID=A0A9P5AHK7_9HYPO|nr:hypothetical protein FBEOM_7368 [Fusarium beomiforme]